MVESVRDLFEQFIPRSLRANPWIHAWYPGRFAFRLTGPESGCWSMTFAGASFSVERAASTAATNGEWEIIADSEMLVAVFRRQRSLQGELLDGHIRITGDEPKALAILEALLTWGCEARPVRPATGSNVEYNRSLWDEYARCWHPAIVFSEDGSLRSGADRDSRVELVGDEWGTRGSIEQVVAEFIVPFVGPSCVAAEIGSGGGRIARRVAPLVGELHCFDISAEMLKRAKAALTDRSNVFYHEMTAASFSIELESRFDFVYAFDVFVHLDLHTIWQYFKEIHRTLKPGAKVFLHTTNLAAPSGWDHFSRQSTYSIEDHYFICPQTIRILAERGSYQIIKESKVDPNNFYYHRDYLFVLEKVERDR